MAENIVSVYTTENCPRCRMTMKWLNSHGINFVTKPAIVAGHRNSELDGYDRLRSAPVVVSKAGVWSGYQPQKLKLLKE